MKSIESECSVTHYLSHHEYCRDGFDEFQVQEGRNGKALVGLWRARLRGYLGREVSHLFSQIINQ